MPASPPWTEEELSEIKALRVAAERLLSRRRLVRRAALTLAWTAPLLESLVVVPDEAEAQGKGKGKDMTKMPMMPMMA